MYMMGSGDHSRLVHVNLGNAGHSVTLLHLAHCRMVFVSVFFKTLLLDTKHSVTDQELSAVPVLNHNPAL